MPGNGSTGSGDPGADAEVSVVCRGCSNAIHVSLGSFVDGGEARCPECGAVRDLDEVGDALGSRDVLLEMIPEEARRRLAPVLSEFPSPV